MIPVVFERVVGLFVEGKARRVRRKICKKI